ncbi:hypothetical protein ASD45_04950 [Pseudolabrys sp. Root1462]|nr:hypothetical protein ASD45_04950 [Pseudolabrys sp. Root1462]
MTRWRRAAIVPDSIVKQPALPLARASSSVLFVEAPGSPVVRLNYRALEREGVARHLTLPCLVVRILLTGCAAPNGAPRSGVITAPGRAFGG